MEQKKTFQGLKVTSSSLKKGRNIREVKGGKGLTPTKQADPVELAEKVKRIKNKIKLDEEKVEKAKLVKATKSPVKNLRRKAEEPIPTSPAKLTRAEQVIARVEKEQELTQNEKEKRAEIAINLANSEIMDWEELADKEESEIAKLNSPVEETRTPE